MDDKESPRRTVYVVTSGAAEASAADRMAASVASCCRVRVSRGRVSRGVCCSRGDWCQAAGASWRGRGAAATVLPEGSLTRAGLQWRPKGLLSAKYAPTGMSEHQT